ncbi:4-alpha-glucanotransferase [bacterium]|nr:4-alpha-glucanotransferase [bacterium]
MYISRIGNLHQTDISFKRRLTNKEQEDYRNNALQSAFDYLGTEEVAMILHGTSFPESKTDIGVGSPYGISAEKLITFDKIHGFNSIQLGPVGVISDAQNISPYKSTVATKNYLFLDMEKLTTDEYANILSQEDIKIASQNIKNNNKNYSYSSFPDAFANYQYCIKIANRNFKEQLKARVPEAIKLNNEFEDFKNKKGNLVKQEALFDILSKMYGTQDYTKWDVIDQNLIKFLKQKNPLAIERYSKLKTRSKEDFETYLLSQFLLDKQVKENTNLRKELEFKYISDLLVGFSPSDEWANQDLFMKDYRMGCPHGGKYGPQLWNIPVIDPNKLFIDENTLGPAGIYLKQKLEAALNDFDNIRIDHALGLIDPYIYDKNSVEIVNNNINLNKFKGNNISNMPEIDPYGNFKRILNKIIIPTLEEHGIDKNYPIWEDLCTDTPVFNQIYHHQNQLPGITQLEWMRAENSQDEHDWGLVGSHDSDPAQKMIKKDWVKNGDAWNIFYLAGFLNSNPKRA